MSEDFDFPKALIARIIKAHMKYGSAVQKEARDAIGMSAKVFIHYVVACAVEISRKNKRQKITDKDVLDALEELGFEDIALNLQEFAQTLNQEAAKKRKPVKSEKSGDKAADASTTNANTTTVVDDDDDDDDNALTANDNDDDDGDGDGDGDDMQQDAVNDEADFDD